jgi:transposase
MLRTPLAAAWLLLPYQTRYGLNEYEKQAKSYGCALSAEYKERCRFSIFITNVKEQVLKTEHIVQLYGLRWQIEQIFKTWKSLLGVDKIKAIKKERLECQLIPRFIWVLINWKIFWCIDTFIQKTSPGYACSAWKFFKQARQDGHT